MLKRYAPGFVANSVVGVHPLDRRLARSASSSFLLAVYRLLTNAEVTVRDVLPGAVVAAVVLEASFQVVPLFVRLADVNPALRVLGGPVILLLWLYVMANVIVFGAEVNWWRRAPRATHEPPGSSASRSARAARARCECSRLPVVAELADGALLAVRDEDRVVAEAAAAARRARDRALERRRCRGTRSPSGAIATSSQT